MAKMGALLPSGIIQTINNLGLIVIRMIIRFGGMHLDMEFLILSNPIPIIGMSIIQKVHPSLSFYGDIV